MKIIKCHMCKLSYDTCGYKCAEVEDVSTLYKEGTTEKDAFPSRVCTAHKCPHNSTGMKCNLDECIIKETVK